MRLTNTLTRSVEELVPRDVGRVAMYVCGPTVYDVPHFGHARAAIVPDVLRRYLEWTGVEVLQVRNLTDIDDKIINRAAEEDRPAAVVAEAYTRAYDDQMSRLRVLPPHVAPRATGHLLEMIGLIERLHEVGAAYQAGGDVWYAVRSFPRYGRLSGRNVDELRAGARVEPDEAKRDPLDFALWKSAKPGEPAWPSPWGPGRPGWHIECSAMAAKYLGSGFDIHSGGADLVFPHHENEIAQSEAATGATFARHWVHNGLLSIGGEKMSKSLGNIISLADALDRHGPDPIRFFFLAAHYRSDIELNDERLAEAVAAIDRWRTFERAARRISGAEGDPGEDRGADGGQDGGQDAGEDRGEDRGEDPVAAEARKRFREAMDDDLSTPKAHAALFDLVAAGHGHLAAGRRREAVAARRTLIELTSVLGYDVAAERGERGELVAGLVEELLAQREAARARRDFAAADAIRARLTDLGVVVEDTRDGPRWHLDGA